MKKIVYLSLIATLSLANNFSDEVYQKSLQKAMEFEQKGDYKNAMLEYKKLAEFSKRKNEILQKEVVKENINTLNKSQDEVKPHYVDLNSQNLDEPKTTLKNEEIKPKISQKLKPLYPKANEENPQWLYMYEPTYIGYAYDFSKKPDRKKGEAKFQISFQKPIFDDILGLDETWSVAYTQKSFWQISQDSAPFRTTDYEPEIFVTMPTDFLGLDYFRVGFNHQSNGEAGEISRSWNRIFAGTSFNLGNLRITPRVWHSFNFDNTNKDIRQYLGYGDIKFNYDIGNHHLTALWRNNLRFDKENRGAIELNYYFPLPFFKELHGFVQYFSGYGESLIDHNKHVDKVMLGIAFYEN